MVRDGVASAIQQWVSSNPTLVLPGVRVVPTYNFESLKGLTKDDDSELIGVVVTAVDEIDDQNGARDCDSDIVTISVFHFRLLESSGESHAESADDATESLRDHLRRLRKIPVGNQSASRIRTTIPTPFDHRKISQSATWAAMIETEYVLEIPGESIDEPPN